MSDKDIQINFKTSADTKGAVQTEKSLEELQVELVKLKQRLNEIPTSSSSFKQISSEVNQAEQSLKKLSTTAAVSAPPQRRFGGAIQQAGYQVGDFAVQLEMGTDKVRAFTQQGSQILGVLGPWGAVAGAALAIGGALLTASKGMKDAKEDSERLTQGLDALKEAADKANQELAMENLEKGKEAYQNQIDLLDQVGGKLEREIGLRKKIANIKMQEADANAALAILQVEQSDMSEIDKIRAIALIKQDVAKKQIELKRQELDAEQSLIDAAADREAKEAEAAAARQNEANVQAENARERQKQAADDIKRAEEAGKKSEEIAKKISGINKELTAIAMGSGEFGPSPEQGLEIAKLREQLDDLRKIKQIYDEIAANPPDAQAFENATEIVKAAETQAEEARKEAIKQAQESEIAGSTAEGFRERVRPAAEGALAAQEQMTQTQITGEAVKSTSKAKEEADKLATEAKIKQLENELTVLKSQQPGLASQAAGQFEQGAFRMNERSGNLRDTFLKVSEQLGNGTNQQEINEIAEMLKKRIQQEGATNVSAFTQIIAIMQQNQAKMSDLEGQIKRLGDKR